MKVHLLYGYEKLVGIFGTDERAKKFSSSVSDFGGSSKIIPIEVDALYNYNDYKLFHIEMTQGGDVRNSLQATDYPDNLISYDNHGNVHYYMFAKDVREAIDKVNEWRLLTLQKKQWGKL